MTEAKRLKTVTDFIADLDQWYQFTAESIDEQRTRLKKWTTEMLADTNVPEWQLRGDRWLGAGANGIVFECSRKAQPGQLYACKVMSLPDWARHEMAVACLVSSWGIAPRVIDFFTLPAPNDQKELASWFVGGVVGDLPRSMLIKRHGESVYFMVMELVSGKTTSQMAKDEGQLPTKAMLQRLAARLELLRHKGIVHGDLTAANVMFGKTTAADEDDVFLIDFAYATIHGEGALAGSADVTSSSTDLDRWWKTLGYRVQFYMKQQQTKVSQQQQHLEHKTATASGLGVVVAEKSVEFVSHNKTTDVIRRATVDSAARMITFDVDSARFTPMLRDMLEQSVPSGWDVELRV